MRRPGARLAGGMLTFPLTDGTLLSFDLEEPYDLLFGWNEVLSRNTGGPTTNSRGLMTYTILSQAGRVLFLQAEDSVREAQSAGWPNSTSASTPELRLRLWASDLVTLVEAVRSHPRPAVAEASPRKRHVTSQT